MKHKNLLILPLLAISLSGCKNSPGLQTYLKTFTFVCHVNGGKYTDEFVADSSHNVKNNTQDFNANVNLNYFEGALNIMPKATEMVAPAGKVFGGWYFDDKALPDNVVSQYAMHKIVNDLPNYEANNIPKKKDIYAKWIDAGTIDVCVELNNTKKIDTSTSYSHHYPMNASFTSAYKAAHPTECGNEVFVKNYNIEQFKIDGVANNMAFPQNKDVTVGDTKYEFARCTLSGSDQDTVTYEEYGDPEGTLQLKLDALSGKEQLFFLGAQYLWHPYVTLVFHTSFNDPDKGSKVGIPGTYTAEAQAKYNAMAINNTYNMAKSGDIELRPQVYLSDLDDAKLAEIAPKKSDAERYDFVDAEKWEAFELGSWEIKEYVNDVGFESRPFTAEYIKANANKFANTIFDCYLVDEFVF